MSSSEDAGWKGLIQDQESVGDIDGFVAEGLGASFSQWLGITFSSFFIEQLQHHSLFFQSQQSGVCVCIS